MQEGPRIGGGPVRGYTKCCPMSGHGLATQASCILGSTTLTQHVVDTGDAKPIRQKPFRATPEVAGSIKREINEMLELGVIVRSNSPWAAGVVLVPKKDLTTRFCVDYQLLNEATVTDAYPMHRVVELLEIRGSANILC